MESFCLYLYPLQLCPCSELMKLLCAVRHDTSIIASAVNVVRPTTVSSLSHWASAIVYSTMGVTHNVVRVCQRQLRLVTGPPNGLVLFCTLSSVGVVCRLSSPVTRVGGRRPTLPGGTVRLRPVMATPCISCMYLRSDITVAFSLTRSHAFEHRRRR